MKKLSEEIGEDFAVSAHYAAKKGVENVANFLGGCGAGRLYIALEPYRDLKLCVIFPTNEDTVFGNISENDFEELWNNNEVLWALRSRENLESYRTAHETVGCGNCKDK